MSINFSAVKVCDFWAFFRNFFAKMCKILTEISGIFGKFSPEFSGIFPGVKTRFTAVSLHFAPFFGGKFRNSEISEISRNSGKSGGNSREFWQKKDKFTGCIFVSPLVQNSGNFGGKFPGNFRKISGNFGKFWKFLEIFPQGTFSKIPEIWGKTTSKKNNLPAVPFDLPLFIPRCPGNFRKIPEN